MRPWISAVLLSVACASDPIDSGDDFGTSADTATTADTEADTVLQICDYVNADDWAVWCGGDSPERLVLNASASDDPECPDFYSVGDGADGEANAAIVDAGCDDSCVYQRSQAVMVLYCDTRGEYIAYTSGGPGQDGDGAACAPLLHVMTVAGSGWYESYQDYQEDFPCPGNAVPVVDNIETTGVIWVPLEGPVVLSESLTITDADDTVLQGATVRITDGYQPGIDQLVLTTRPLGVSGSYDSRTGTFTLQGEAPVAVYQSALRSVAYNGTSESSGPKTLHVQVSDGSSQSEPVTRVLRILDVEDGPQ